MEIKHISKKTKGEFKAEEDSIDAGSLTYSWKGADRIIIEHTVVNPDFKGQGIGRELIEAAIDFAREKQVKIVPLCSYARHVFDKTPEFSDVL